MKEIVEAQKKWQKAKDQARRICLERGKSDLADRISVCTMFKGTENLDDAASLVFSAQGSEFMTRFGFPSLDTFRSFLKFNPEKYGAYIDKGKIALSGEKRILLVGNTIARIKCDETALYRIILMHGASAVIDASGYSVVKVEKDGVSSHDINVSDFAKVMK